MGVVSHYIYDNLLYSNRKWIHSFIPEGHFLYVLFYFIFFGLVACGTLIPQPGIKPARPCSGSTES